MFPGRKLLYHRGIDDSIGTYVTDYVLVVECLILFLVLSGYLFKNWPELRSKKLFSRSTLSLCMILICFSVAALVGGLVHQFLQTVEPYHDHHDAMGWLIVWRLAGAITGVVAFAYFILIENMITTEKILRRRSYISTIYYAVAALYSLGLCCYSIWLIFSPDDPWSLTNTFILLSVVVIIEALTSFFVLVKRFAGNSDKYEEVIGSNLRITPSENSENQSKKNVKVEIDRNFNNTKKPAKRLDLLLHFVGTIIFVIGGIAQIILAKFFSCGKDNDPAAQRCPLPTSFNHNSVLHVLQMITAFFYFVAEIMAVERRKLLNNDKKPANS